MTEFSPATIPQQEENQLGMPSNMLAVMRQFAMESPRNPIQAQADALAELEAFPAFAEKAYYSIPYNQGQANETRVEGPSIKAAMVLARCWRNFLTGGRITGEDDSNVYVEGMVFDIETNTPNMRPIRVSKFYKPRGSDGLKRKNADMLYNSVQAGVSKAIRNAVLATLPVPMVDAYFQRAKELVMKPPKGHPEAEKSIGERIVEAKKIFFKQFKINPAQLDEYLANNADSLEDDKAILLHLKGLYNSFKDHPKMVEETFGEPESKPEKKK